MNADIQYLAMDKPPCFSKMVVTCRGSRAGLGWRADDGR